MSFKRVAFKSTLLSYSEWIPSGSHWDRIFVYGSVLGLNEFQLAPENSTKLGL